MIGSIRWVGLAAASLAMSTIVSCRDVSRPAESVPDDLRSGRLGHPLGTYLTIGGVREMAGKSGDGTMRVDTVDGQRFDPPVQIWIDNVKLDESVRVELVGYESGRYIGIPDDVSRATGEVSQAAWQFQRYFIATSIGSGGTWR